MTIEGSRAFKEQFKAAHSAMERAMALSDEALCAYYLGTMVGLLLPHLPEEEAAALLTVTAPGIIGIDRTIAPTLSKASELLRSHLPES